MAARWFMVVIVAAGLMPRPSSASPYTFGYGGRLVDGSNRAIPGPVDLELRFWSAATAGTDLLGHPLTFTGTVLDDGVFQVDASAAQFPASDMQKVFTPAGDTWVEVRDVTHSLTYPRQRLTAVPFALQVPVDGKTLTYDGSGNLTLVAGAPAPGQILSTDATGKLAWESSTSASSTSGSGSGSVTSVLAGTGLTVSGGAAGITTTGTLNVNVGTAANQIVQMGSDGKLPAVDGSKLTGLLASSLTGTLPAGSGANLTSLNASNVSSGTLAVANGGTGAASASAARTSLGAAAAGTNTDITALNGLGFAAGSIVVANGTGLAQDAANFSWDSTNKRLAIGTSAPTARLQVATAASTVGLIVKGANAQSADLAEFQDSSGAPQFIITNGGALQFRGGTGNNIQLGAPATNSAFTLFLPSSDGANGQLLQTDGAGHLGWSSALAFSSGKVGIGATSPTYTLQVTPTSAAANQTMLLQDQTPTTGATKLVIKDGAAQNAGNTFPLEVQDISGTQKFAVRDTGQIVAGSIAGLAGTLSVQGSMGAGTGASVQINDFSRGATFGLSQMELVSGNFNPTSGTGAFNALDINSTINQTGGASGATRGIFIDPTLTAAADYRALEMNNAAGFGILQTGSSAINGFVGAVGIGTTSPKATLQVTGTVALSSQIVTSCSATTISSTVAVAIFAASSGGAAITLPTCSAANAGQVLTITNASSGCSWSLSATNLNGSSTTVFPSSGNSRTLTCDSGTSSWY